mmetsp:Transcript_24077/g.72256  ORF Transcript_24077/g.72256 Transcript_24077/m.72256 type:complete len:81 (-) Transcript_24077:1227-1469(-)
MDALQKALTSPDVGPPLAWGTGCGAVAALHSYASLWASAPKPRTRLLRSVDVGVVIFAISASLAYYARPDAAAEPEAAAE